MWELGVEVAKNIAFIAIFSFVGEVDDLWNLYLLGKEKVVDLLELLLEVLSHLLYPHLFEPPFLCQIDPFLCLLLLKRVHFPLNWLVSIGPTRKSLLSCRYDDGLLKVC